VRKEGTVFRSLAAWLPPLLMGLLACLLITGGTMLRPENVRWLTQGDLAQSYLGWAFYRHAAWGWPTGANALYGAGLHTSVYYSDSIPLLAMLLKPWAAWLPEPFQYFGFWLLACFALQAWFAWRLLGIVHAHPVARSLGVLFFVCAPPMLARLSGHMALVGHWIVLAAIYLCVRTQRRHQALWWAVLLAMAMMVHAYLFAIAGAIWLADCVQHARTLARDAQQVRNAWASILLPQMALVMIVTVLAAWLAGLFMVSGQATQAEGFGYYKMNVLAPINGAGWSRLGLNFPQAPGEYEGFNYFGAGGLLLIVSAVSMTVFGRKERRRMRMPWGLIAVAVLLAVAAVTPDVGVGAAQWHMPMPEKWHTALTHIPLQSTGRLFWATYYIVLLAALYAVVQACSLRWQILLLAGAIALQGVDLAPGLVNLHTTLASRARDQTVPGLHGAFWDDAGRRYKLLRVLPLSKRGDWEQLAFYANSHRMGMDGVQLARIDMNRFLALYNAQQEALLDDTLDPQTLYVLDDRDVAVAQAGILPQHAALFRLDGKNVLAPGWTEALPAAAIDLRSAGRPLPYALPFKSGFSQDDGGRLLLGQGWNATGAGLLSLTDTATLFVPGGDGQQPLRVELQLHRVNTGKSMAATLEAWSDGKRIGRCDMAGDGCRSWTFDVPGEPNAPYFRRIELRPTTPGAKLRITLDAISVR
jgi:hypothetical protein